MGESFIIEACTIGKRQGREHGCQNLVGLPEYDKHKIEFQWPTIHEAIRTFTVTKNHRADRVVKGKTIAAGRARQALNFVSRTTDESSSTLESLEATTQHMRFAISSGSGKDMERV